jgi:hypothetical protein
MNRKKNLLKQCSSQKGHSPTYEYHQPCKGKPTGSFSQREKWRAMGKASSGAELGEARHMLPGHDIRVLSGRIGYGL